MDKEMRKNHHYFYLFMGIILIVQFTTIMFFCVQKEGFHYDEYYSYYSSNVTYGLVPSDEEWKSTDEIKSEFRVAADAEFSYKTVNRMQSYDVHPPLYYFLLHTVCSLTPGVFSKWQGLSVNLIFFVLSWILLAKITALLSADNKKMILSVCLLFGFSPAVYSGITFIRMYMLLTFWCMLLLYIHGKAFVFGRRTWRSFYVPVMVVSFLGFYTHYYFIVFLFFLAAFTFLSMLLHKEQRKQATCYAASVVAGVLFTVMAYPACLSHIFRGYRGTEAMDAFFDLGNLIDRVSFFTSLLNDYVLCYSFFALLLIILVLAVTWRYISAKKGKIQVAVFTKQMQQEKGRKKLLWSIVFVVLGYFLVVAKTALLNAEEAIRYEMPVYGLIILLLVFGLYHLLEQLLTLKNAKMVKYFFLVIVLFTLMMQLTGLTKQKVLFLYPQDKENIEWASAHETEPVVYIYNPDNQWMIWDDSEELMQYAQIYFINMNHEELKEDITLKSADHIYVYASRSDNSDKMIQDLLSQNSRLKECVKIRELLYCDLYELK